MLRVLLLCLLLAACSSVESLPENLPAAPSLSTAAAVLKNVAVQAHIDEPLEVSDPIKAHSISFAAGDCRARERATCVGSA